MNPITNTGSPEAQEENYRLLVDNLEDHAVFMTDAEGKITTWNNSIQKQFGYYEDEFLGESSSIIFTKTDTAVGVPAQEIAKAIAKRSTKKDRLYLRKDGSEIWMSAVLNSLQDRSGKCTGILHLLRNVGERKSIETAIGKHEDHDALTGLPNRKLFSLKLGEALNEAKRSKHGLALLFIDLDNFKDINDTEGYEAGDALLQEVGKRLKETVGDLGSVARLGGDEFMIVLNVIKEPEHSTPLVEKILKSFQEVFIVNRKRVYTTASIGVSLFPKNGRDSKNVLRTAARALYQAKLDGSNSYKFYNERKNNAEGHAVIKDQKGKT